MKTKTIVLAALISAGLLTGTTALARGGRGSCGRTPVCDSSGKAVNPNRGNPGSKGTPLLDGSGKAAAPGKGAKNRPNCPNR